MLCTFPPPAPQVILLYPGDVVGDKTPITPSWRWKNSGIPWPASSTYGSCQVRRRLDHLSTVRSEAVIAMQCAEIPPIRKATPRGMRIFFWMPWTCSAARASMTLVAGLVLDLVTSTFLSGCTLSISFLIEPLGEALVNVTSVFSMSLTLVGILFRPFQ